MEINKKIVQLTLNEEDLEYLNKILEICRPKLNEITKLFDHPDVQVSRGYFHWEVKKINELYDKLCNL